MYAPLPVPPPRNPSEPADHYGRRLALWCLSVDGVTATVETADLELMAYALTAASTTRGYFPTVYQQLTDLRHVVDRVLVQRRAELAADPVTIAPTPAERPNTGPMAPLVPVQPSYPPRGDTIAF